MIADLLAAAPLIIVPLLLVTNRMSTLGAGLVGIGAASGAVFLINNGPDVIGNLNNAVLRGLWLSLQAVLFIVAGLFFYNCLHISDRRLFQAPFDETTTTSVNHRRLYSACFLLGPFAESVTGFGVGMIIAIPMILGAGVRGFPALGFALFTQMLVVWGSLGVGSAIGAELAGITFADLAYRSAILEGPVLFGHLLVFWFFLNRIGSRLTLVRILDDILWTAALAILLTIVTVQVAPELGGLLATGLMLVVRAWRDHPSLPRRAVPILSFAWPYMGLTLFAVVTRTVPDLSAYLRSMWMISPWANEVPLSPFYHPAFLLIAFGLLALIAGGRATKLGMVLTEVGRVSLKPVMVTMIYVILARIIGDGGLAERVADNALVFGQNIGILCTFLAGLSGFLTGSNTASNGLMMPVQAALAQAAARDIGWFAALQNVGGSTLTMLSPIRISTACALLGLRQHERSAYALVWPVGAVALVILVLSIWALG